MLSKFHCVSRAISPVSSGRGMIISKALSSTQTTYFSTRPTPSPGLSQQGGVHQAKNSGSARNFRNKPLLRRDGDRIFKTGKEASDLLEMEALRKDKENVVFVDGYTEMAHALNGVFDRMPKYAWVLKQMLEPERTVIFRVAWIDDQGISRVNRGYRVQYSSALGPFEGGLNFHQDLRVDDVKAYAFHTTFANALQTGGSFGGSFGGADFNPYDKSENEIQRFCQSFMTELSKYIGPDFDLPGMGDGVSETEIGYMYGQYKRINQHSHVARLGRGLMWGGAPNHRVAKGMGIAYFAKAILQDQGSSLEGKRVLITGSEHTAVSVAQKVLDLGGIPISFSDSSGHIYEPNGFDAAKLKTVAKIKSDRGARVGRYIIASTTAQYNENDSVFDIPCDIVFNCSRVTPMQPEHVKKLHENGCKLILEGAMQVTTKEALKTAKKNGIIVAPFKATSSASGIVNGVALEEEPLTNDQLNQVVDETMKGVYNDIKSTAAEFNCRGDLVTGANIAGFLKVADAMVAHGSV